MRECQVHQGCLKEVELKRLNEPIYLTLSQRQNHRDRREVGRGRTAEESRQQRRRKFGGVLELVYILIVVVVTPFVCLTKLYYNKGEFTGYKFYLNKSERGDLKKYL